MKLPFLDEVYERVTFNRELVFRFFTVFSLFEYALKQVGDIRKGEFAEPDWDMFAARINEKFDRNRTDELKEAVEYLLTFPPKKQVVENKRIVFCTVLANKPSNTGDLSVYIRRVRNNLFHGGKFGYDENRDSRLIECCLIVLEEWASLDENVLRELGNVK